MIDLFGGSQMEKHCPMTGRHDNPGGGPVERGASTVTSVRMSPVKASRNIPVI